MSDSIVLDALEALAGNDPGRIHALFAPDAEWLSPPGNAVSVALDAPHHMVGAEAIARFFTVDMRRLFVRDLDVVFRGAHTGADGEHATAEVTVTATLPDGRTYANDYCFVFEVRDGLVRRVREYTDTALGHRMVFGGGEEVSTGGVSG